MLVWNPHTEAGNLTLYEEIGVAPDATASEIHGAYRKLARLRHPDLLPQGDETSKETAVREMQRLNSIVELLTDTNKRAAYDASLLPKPVLVVQSWPLPPAKTSHPIRWQWAALILLTLGGGAWLYLDRSPYPGQLASEADPPVQRVPDRTPSAPRTESATTARRRLVAPESPFAGNWTYTPTADAESPVPSSSTDVESAQLHLVDQQGTLFGHYSVRYRPEPDAPKGMDFAVSGRVVSTEGAVLAWSSIDGESGTVQLSLFSPRRLSLQWRRTDTRKAPASGSVILTKTAD